MSKVVEVDYSALGEGDFVAVNDFENAMGAEALPDDPPTPLERTVAWMTNIPSHLAYREFWVRDDKRVVGLADAMWRNTEENRHLAWIDLQVLAPYRGRGIGRELLRQIVEIVKEDNRTVLSVQTTDRVPAGEAFARRVGAEAKQTVHTNRLLMSDVDRGLVRSWLDEAPGRAPGYSLVAVDGPLPDDIVENAVRALDVMNTAPRDDLDWEDSRLTVEQMREIEKAGVAEGTERWFVFARHDATGEFVGVTEMFWNPSKPKTVYQGDTGVHPDHRGHALGKWLKATTADRLIRERPQVEDIRTGNADSNDAMLGINHALGFKPYIEHVNWQVAVDAVDRYLDQSV